MLTHHEDYFFFLGDIPLCTLYCNAVLANLNSRDYLRGPNVVNNSAFNRISVGTSMEFDPVSSPVLKDELLAKPVDTS